MSDRRDHQHDDDPVRETAHGHQETNEHDPACDVAHGTAPAPPTERVLVAVFDSPVARLLLRYGADAGFRPVLVEPDAGRASAAADRAAADGAGDRRGSADGHARVEVLTTLGDYPPGRADVVVTDHHRPELGPMLRDALASQARWVGIMGNPRHPAPHIPALTVLGVPAEQIGRVHRPIGINIGSHTPAEIAIATLAGLIADRNGCPGGFEF